MVQNSGHIEAKIIKIMPFSIGRSWADSANSLILKAKDLEISIPAWGVNIADCSLRFSKNL